MLGDAGSFASFWCRIRNDNVESTLAQPESANDVRGATAVPVLHSWLVAEADHVAAYQIVVDLQRIGITDGVADEKGATSDHVSQRSEPTRMQVGHAEIAADRVVFSVAVDGDWNALTLAVCQPRVIQPQRRDRGAGARPATTAEQGEAATDGS